MNSLIDSAAKGILVVLYLYVIFYVCRWAWRLLIRSAKAARRHAPDSLEGAARATGKSMKMASELGRKLKKAFDEGRK